MKWPAPIDHAYLLCDPAIEPVRAAFLQKWLRDNAISDDSYTMRLECYGTTLSAEQAMKAYDPTIHRPEVPGQQRNFNSMNLKLSEISLGINWAAAAQDAVKKGYTTVLFLESDVLLTSTFYKELEESLAMLHETHWDFLSLSDGPGLRPRRAPGDIKRAWFQVNHYYHTRTTDAMVFKVSMLSNILTTFFPFAEIIDWELNYQLARHRSRSFWLDPPIIKQGSGTVYPTTL